MIIQRKISLDKDHVEWFEATFPQTSLSGIVNLFLEKLKENMGEYTPEHFIDMVVKQTLEGD